MSNNKDTIQSLRESLGYVNSGNTNKYMFRFNWLLVAMSATVVGLIWGIRNSNSIDKNDTEKKDLLIMGIIAATIFFLVVLPINVGKVFYGDISRHPIYLTYAIISAIFTVYLAIYYGQIAKGGEQGSYILGALIITLIIALLSFYLYIATIYPYSRFGLDILSDNDYYNINNDAYAEYKLIEKVIAKNNADSIDKFITKDEWSKILKIAYKYDVKEDLTFDNVLAVKRSLIPISEKYKKEFYKLGKIKQAYNKILVDKFNNKDKKDFESKFSNLSREITKANPMANTEFAKVGGAIQRKAARNEFLNTDEYNKYFGFYDPYIGLGGAAGAGNVYLANREEIADTNKKLDTYKGTVYAYNKTKKNTGLSTTLQTAITTHNSAPGATQIKGKQDVLINNYIEEQTKQGKLITGTDTDIANAIVKEASKN